MAQVLSGLLHRFRPHRGWIPFLLTLVALLCPPAALLQAVRDPSGLDSLVILTILGLVFGLKLARSRIQARGAAGMAGVIGVILLVIFVGGLTPPIRLLLHEVGYAADWFELKQQGLLGWPLPFGSTAGYAWQQLGLLGNRLLWWSQGVAVGQQVHDNIALLLLAAFLSWLLSVFAAWRIYRHQSALVGLLPGGIVMTLIAFFAGGMAIFYLLAYLLCTLALTAACHLWVRRSRWEESGTDYPGEMGTELALALGPGLVLILVLAIAFPVIYPSRIRDAFWQVLEGPWSHVEQVAERLFGPIDVGYSIGGTGLGGDMPSAHLLGGSPDLGERVVLYVITNDPPPAPSVPEDQQPRQAAPVRYWRGATYDIYTGQGWTTSPVESRSTVANETLVTNPQGPQSTDNPDTGLLVQQFERAAPQDTRIYAANSPLQIDQPIETWWRAPDDLSHLTGKVEDYTVISRPPEPTVSDLQARSLITQTLTQRAVEGYLTLPVLLPQRVRDLAHQVVGDASTPYDRIRAIETFLRAYPYNLDLPDPPTDRDLVDYFLFDLQEGYCDYYASAMVIMAREVGVPARLASGYAQGTYDQDLGRWVVTEKDGHSWVEVYFDGIGWVEFEPTAGLPALERPGGMTQSPIELPPLPRRTLFSWEQIPWSLVGLGSVLLLLIAVVVWTWRPRKADDTLAADLIRDRHARLVRWGLRLGHPMLDGQTPHEYAGLLANALLRRGQRSTWPQVRNASDQAQPDVEHLTASFVRAQYSAEPISDREGRQIRTLWARLRRNLWWLWLSKG